jgi:HEAT repeat protein
MMKWSVLCLSILSVLIFGCSEPEYKGRPCSYWIEKSKSNSVEDRISAAQALGKIGLEAKESIPNLIRLIGDKDNKVQLAALESTGNLGSDAKEAIPSLTELLRDDTKNEVLVATIKTLGKMGVESKATVPELTVLFRNKDLKIRQTAAIALAKIGEPNEVIPELITQLRSNDKNERQAAANALMGMGNKGIYALNEMLDDKDWQVQNIVIETLGITGPEAKIAVPRLIGLLSSKNVQIRLRAAQTLGDIGPEAQAAIPELEKMLLFDHLDPKTDVIVTSDMPESINDLVRDDMMNRITIRLKETATHALSKIGSAATPALTHEYVLYDENNAILAVRALGNMGPKARKAIPELRNLLKQKDFWINNNKRKSMMPNPMDDPRLTQKWDQLQKATEQALDSIGKESIP